MKISKFLISLIFLGLNQMILAQPASTKVEVRVLDQGLNLDTVAGEQVKVEYGVPSRSASEALPTATELDALLLKAGLDEFLKQADQLDKDMLFRWGRHLSVEDFCKKFSHHPQDELEAFHRLINESGK